MTDPDQYKDGSNLTVRADLHRKYGTSEVDWFTWVARQVEWPPYAPVLEVGCGTGWLWPAVSDVLTAPIALTLTDLSSGMISEARGRTTGLDNVRVVGAEVAPAQALPFTDASFQVVVANHMLYHVPDPPSALAELRRVLREDGVLLAATNGRGHMRELFDIGHEIFGVHGGQYAEVFGRENGLGLLRDCFSQVEWRPFADGLHCTDVDDVAAYIASTQSAQPSPELRAAVAARFVDGGLSVTKDTGLILARR